MPKKRKTQAQPAALKKSKSDAFDTQYLLTNTKSCLASANLSSLINASTWELLSAEEKQSCLQLLPAVDKVNEQGTQELAPDFFIGNAFLQEAIRTVQRSLQDGELMPGYQKRLAQASANRAAGKADAYKEEQFEQNWGDLSRP